MFLLRNEIYVMTGLNKDKVSFTTIYFVNTFLVLSDRERRPGMERTK